MLPLLLSLRHLPLLLCLACSTASSSAEVVGSDQEPQPTASSTIILRDDFESYDGTCRSMDVSGGGRWRTSSGSCGTDPNGVISSPDGTGYAGDVSGVGGRSARWNWPVSTQEQFFPLEASVRGFKGRGGGEYYSFWYRAPRFVYRTSFPRLGKKLFLLFPANRSSHGAGRVTINPSEFSILQSNGVKIDAQFDHWPAGVPSEDAFLAYLTDGRWHRYTVMRIPETRDRAMNGALRVWVDGYLVVERGRLGTFAAPTESVLLGGTFNGGSSRVQSEYIDDVVAWR